ncbi:MAG: MscS Mechanosensitive ion channel [Deltaproteobacteria bacterium]|nr:MscS Mechanosensitive ion channel [Deltaproteobacteria bacterium]
MTERERLERFAIKISASVVLISIVLAMLGVHHSFAAADRAHAKDAAVREPQSTRTGYPVMLADKTLFYIMNDVKGYSAQERANVLTERLQAVAKDLTIPIDSVSIQEFSEPMIIINARDKLLLSVFDEDARAENMTRYELAQQRSKVLQTAIAEYRHDRSRKQILLGVVYSVLATFGLLIIVYAVLRIYRALSARLRVWADAKMSAVQAKSLDIVSAERSQAILAWLIRIVRFIILLFVFYAYVDLVLHFFPWTRPIAGKLLGYVTSAVGTIGNAVWEAIPNLLFVSVIAFFTVIVLKVMKFLFKGLESGVIKIQGFFPEWSQPTYKLCRILVVAFAAVVAFPYIPGSDSPAFRGVSIFLGVLFSLGSTSAIANILAGYSLTYRRVFKIGDRVKIADFVGDVIEMRLQVVKLKTIKNEVIVVPSSVVVNSNVINYNMLAKETGLILHTKITIGYDTPWRQVEALLLMAADRTTGILKQPAPFILQTSLDDFYVSYELNVYSDDPQKMIETYAHLHRNIQDAFNEYDVQIMSPSYRGDPAEPKIVPKERWYTPPAKKPDE